MRTQSIRAEDFALYIKEYRKLKNLTQTQFANMVGCTQRCVSEWENQKTLPQKSKQAKIMELLQPYMSELEDILSVQDITNTAHPQDNRELLISSLEEYARREPDRYRLMLQVHDLNKENVYLLIELASRLNDLESS